MSAVTAALPETEPPIIDDPLELGRFTRWIVGTQGERLGESSLQIGGMHCAACAGIIEQALDRVEGVCSARVSAAAQRATVCWDPSRTRPSALIDAVRAAGYDAVPDLAAGARALRRKEHRQALWRLFVASFCAMQVMMMSTPSYVAGPGELAPDLRQLLNWGSWLLSLPVLLFAAGPFFSGAWRGLRQGRIGMDLPVALGVGITFVASTAATFDPGGRFGSRGVLRFDDHVRELPARGALPRTSCAPGRSRGAGAQHGLPARDRLARRTRRQHHRDQRPAPAARRPRARTGGPGVSGRRPARAGRHARRRGLAQWRGACRSTRPRVPKSSPAASTSARRC